MMLMFIIMLIRDDVDVNDDIEMRLCWFWWCHYDGCMLSMYMRDAVTMLDIPGGGNKVVKEF